MQKLGTFSKHLNWPFDVRILPPVVQQSADGNQLEQGLHKRGVVDQDVDVVGRTEEDGDQALGTPEYC